MFGIFLWSILMARNVRGFSLCRKTLPDLSTLQGNKLASGILFAILLNFKHIYMYLAVSAAVHFVRYISNLDSACLFRLPSSCILPDPWWTGRGGELPRPCQLSHRRFRGVSRPICSDGPDTPAAFAPVPFHERVEPRVLGAQLLGPCHRC